MNAERPGSRAGPFVLAITFLRRILPTDLVQQVGMTVEQAQELVERLPLPGFTPLVLGKGADAGPKISPASL